MAAIVKILFKKKSVKRTRNFESYKLGLCASSISSGGWDDFSHPLSVIGTVTFNPRENA